MSTELSTVDAGGEVRVAPSAVPLCGGPEAVQAAIRALNAVREFVAAELKPDHDFGVVPGTRGKPSLFKPGAEKIAMYFNAWPQYEVQALPIGDAGHIEYLITCRLISRASGAIVGSGVGSCSTMESKYRYRTERQGKQESRIEHPNIADVRNTVLKMAKKRAQVDASLSLSCVSDLFTQDLEDLPPPREAVESGRGRPAPARREAPRRPPARPAPRYGDWVKDLRRRWHDFDPIPTDAEWRGRYSRLANRMITDAIGDNLVYKQAVVNPATGKRDRNEVKGALVWLFREHRAWLDQARDKYLREKQGQALGIEATDDQTAIDEIDYATMSDDQAREALGPGANG